VNNTLYFHSSPVKVQKAPEESGAFSFHLHMAYPLFKDEFPRLAAALEQELGRESEPALAKQVRTLAIAERCRYGDEFCASFFTAADSSAADSARSGGFWLENGIIHLQDGLIFEIELIGADASPEEREIKQRLQVLSPAPPGEEASLVHSRAKGGNAARVRWAILALSLAGACSALVFLARCRWAS
jgi:hypothetical protein